MACKQTKVCCTENFERKMPKLIWKHTERIPSYLEWHLSHRDHLFKKYNLLCACDIAGGILYGRYMESGFLFPTPLSLINHKILLFIEQLPLNHGLSHKAFIQTMKLGFREDK